MKKKCYHEQIQEQEKESSKRWKETDYPPGPEEKKETMIKRVEKLEENR